MADSETGLVAVLFYRPVSLRAVLG